MEKQNNSRDELRILTTYPYSDEFDFITKLERLNLDEERKEDIRTGRGFIIDEPQGIKKDIKTQGGIFSSRFGPTLQDVDALSGKYRCNCGNPKMRGTLYHGTICPVCGSMVRYQDDDMHIFAWMVVNDYYIIHPNMYKTLEQLIGGPRLDRIIDAEINIDENGKELELIPDSKKKDEQFKGIGLVGLYNRFDEVIQYYVKRYPKKQKYYDDLMENRSIIWTHSIPVFTALLRPVKLDNAGSLKYEKSNETYNMLAKLVANANRNRLIIDRQKKHKYALLYDIQTNFNELYAELKQVLNTKKGDIRSCVGGRFAFSGRSVIRQDPMLMPDQVKLSYSMLCELLQQVIENILVRTYNFSYAEAYKKRYKAQIKFDQIIYDIIDGLIKDSDGGLPLWINRNPTINRGGVLFVRCVGINKDYTMSLSVLVLKLLAGDFDGDTINILYLFNKDVIEVSERCISPRYMFISNNDGRVNMDMMHARDTIINANAMKSLHEYSEEQKQKIKWLQTIE